MQTGKSAVAAALVVLLGVGSVAATELDFSFSANPDPYPGYGGSASNTDAFVPDTTYYGSYIVNGNPYDTWLSHDTGNGLWDDFVNPLAQHADGGVGYTPEIVVTFPAGGIRESVYFDPAYGDLDDVLYVNSSASGQAWPFSLSDDNTNPGVNPVLHSFDLAYFGGGTLDTVQVQTFDGVNLTTLWSTTNVVLPVDGHVTFDFGGTPIEGTEESLWISYTTQANEPIYNVAVDNVVFSQSQAAPTAQHTITSVSPAVIYDNSTNTTITIEGTDLGGVTSATLVNGGTVINVDGGGVTVAGDGRSLTATFLTAGEPVGDYDVVVPKPGVTDATLPDGFSIREPISLLLNGGFEDDAEPDGTPDHWSITGDGTVYVDGVHPQGSVPPHDGARFVLTEASGLVNEATAYQNVGLPLGPYSYDLTLSFWVYFYDVGDDRDRLTAKLFIDDKEVDRLEVNSDEEILETWLAKSLSWSGMAHTSVAVQFEFDANGGGVGEWGIVGLDDVSLLHDVPPNQHIVSSIDPPLIADNSSDTPVTIHGHDLVGVTSATLVQGGTVINVDGGGVTVAPDGQSMTATFETSGQPAGWYDVVVPKAGVADATLTRGFFIRGDGVSLVFNGDFETGDKSGWIDWGRGWSGDMDVSYVGDASDFWVNTPKILGVDTPTFDDWSYRLGENNNNGGDAGIRQTIDVVPGETLSLTFQWGGGSSLERTVHQIGVVEGEQSGNAGWTGELAVATKGIFDPPSQVVGLFGWEDRVLTFEVPVDVDKITIYVRNWHFPDSPYQYHATWVDEMTLTIPDPCPVQHEPSGIDPVAWDANLPLDLTVSGTDMDLVTLVRLRQGALEYVGQITNSTSGSVTAQFDPPPGGAVLGEYDVETEQTDCLTRIQGGAFTYICDSGLTDVSPTLLQKPQGLVQLTVNGVNVDRADSVRLVWDRELRSVGHPTTGEPVVYWLPVVEIQGSVIDAGDPDAVVMEFDLTGAPVGSYHLVADWGDSCGARVDNAFELTLPEGLDLLANGGFESGVFDPWVAVPAGMTDYGDPMPGPLVEASPWTDGFGFIAPDGSFLAGTRASSFNEFDRFTPNGGTITQTLPELPNGPGQYDLTLVFWLRMFDQIPGGSGQPTRTIAEIVIDEGTPQETVTSITAAFPDEFDEMSQDGDDPFARLSVDYSGEVTTSIAVRFFTMADCQNNYGWPTVIGIDGVQLLGPEQICNDPFADTDADGDVDQEDFSIAQQCYSGDGNAYPEDVPYCRCLDRPEVGNPPQPDGDVDAADLAAFEDCASGAGVPADSNCDGSN